MTEQHTFPFSGASLVLAVTLTVRFLLELALLAGVATLAWTLGAGWWLWPSVLLAVVSVATLWGLVLSPKARFPPPPPIALTLEAVLFIGTGAGLFTIGLGTPAMIGLVIWAIHRVTLALVSVPQ